MNISEEPPSFVSRATRWIGSADRLYFHLGRRLLSPFLPALKLPSEEEITREPEYRKNLILAGQSPVAAATGLIWAVIGQSLGFEWWVAAVGVGLFAVALFSAGTSFLTLRVALRVRSRAVSEVDARLAGDPSFRDVERIRSERTSLEERL